MKLWKPFVLLCFGGVLPSACIRPVENETPKLHNQANEALPIYGGTDAQNWYNTVGLIRENNERSCTGTVIANVTDPAPPSGRTARQCAVVLTAYHCAMQPSDDLIEFSSSDAGTRGTALGRIYYTFTPQGTAPAADLALMILDRPFLFNTYPTLSNQAPTTETDQWFVGFGPPLSNGASVRRYATTYHEATSTMLLPTLPLQVNAYVNSFNANVHICKGDSGGPVRGADLAINSVLSRGQLPWIMCVRSRAPGQNDNETTGCNGANSLNRNFFRQAPIEDVLDANTVGEVCWDKNAQLEWLTTNHRMDLMTYADAVDVCSNFGETWRIAEHEDIQTLSAGVGTPEIKRWRLITEKNWEWETALIKRNPQSTDPNATYAMLFNTGVLASIDDPNTITNCGRTTFLKTVPIPQYRTRLLNSMNLAASVCHRNTRSASVCVESGLEYASNSCCTDPLLPPDPSACASGSGQWIVGTEPGTWLCDSGGEEGTELVCAQSQGTPLPVPEPTSYPVEDPVYGVDETPLPTPEAK